MTTKQIAEIAGVSSKTVTRTAKEKGIGIIRPSVETIFTEAEAIQIMAELRKKGFVQPRQNVEQPRQNVAEARLDRLESMVEKLCIAVTGITQAVALNQSIHAAPQIAPSKPALPPIDPRKELNMLAKEAGYLMGNYSEPWNQIYKHAYYRLGVNFRERAKNRGMEILDYADAEGYTPQLVAIAREIFKS